MDDKPLPYRLYCDSCGYDRFTDGTDLGDMKIHERSKVMTTVPKLDEKTKKTKPATFISLPKQFKCPKCGRLVRPKKNPQFKEDKNNDNPLYL